MFRNRNNDIYIKSNAANLPPILSYESLAEAHQQYLFCRSMQTISEHALQLLTDLVVRAFGCNPIRVALGGIQPFKTRSTGSLKQKTMGTYHYGNTQRYPSIDIYEFTAKRHQRIAAKTSVATLIHEINHHIDSDKLGLIPSLHTKGFYLRIGELQQLLTAP